MQSIADIIVADDDGPNAHRDQAADHDDDRDQVEKLMVIGISIGGARPKAVVEDEAGLWIAKFNRPDDLGTVRGLSTRCFCSPEPVA